MRQWAERHDIEGTGLETNPAFLDFARNRRPRRGSITFLEGPAENFVPETASYDVALCLGATFALGGFVQSVEWMVRAVKTGGAVVVGDLSLKHRPAVNTHQHLPLDAVELAAVMQRHDVEVSAMISASDADFERYASHHRHATIRWAIENPSHPDHDEVLNKSADDWNYYLRHDPPASGLDHHRGAQGLERLVGDDRRRVLVLLADAEQLALLGDQHTAQHQQAHDHVARARWA